ncbi:MAG TPA: hypothetical protein VKK79_08275 [Candidatus Lokiarchaeia archaeon]|nr:hypothetical protein [Candidatus Lokiarchaeia archaeon]
MPVIDGHTKLNIARKLLLKEFSTIIQNMIMEPKHPVLTIIFKDGFHLAVRYNDFGEYSYQLTFSQGPFDRILFDNYDNRWEVTTRPHHYHPRGQKSAQESIMKGNPRHDIPLLIPFIKQNPNS